MPLSSYPEPNEYEEPVMTTTITVRRADPADIDPLFRMYVGGTLGSRPDLLRQGLSALLSGPHLGFIVVAEVEHRIVGMLRVAFEWSPYRNGTFWWVENVYVVPDWRRKGVYRAMHKFVYVAATADADVCGIRLYAEGDNHAARRTYASVGMCGREVEMFEIDFVYGKE